MADDNQIKIHSNQYSKEGIGQQVIDMSVAIAKLSTDMEWVKETLIDIKNRLEHNDEEVKKIVGEFREYVDKRLEEHEERISELESFRAKIKGVAIAVGALLSSSLLIYLLGKVFGG